MRATSGFFRLFIRGLSWDSQDAGAAFYDTLKQAARARLTDSSKGKVLTGTGNGGANVTYMLPPIGDMTAQDIATVCGEVLDKADALIAATPTITDDQLVAAILAFYPDRSATVGPLRMVRQDFSFGLRRIS